LITFRKEAVIVTGEPHELKSIVESPKPSTGPLLQSYCNKDGAPKPSNAKIKIFQHENAPRAFDNIKEMLDAAQEFTTVPVQAITTTELNTIQEQIRFDEYMTISYLALGTCLKSSFLIPVDYSTRSIS
jgi:hypothetical protein